MPARVRIVIVSTDDGEWLSNCLESIEKSGFSGFEVALVDNSCSDNTAEIARASSLIDQVYLTNTKMGFADANNLAIRDNRAEYVFLLNPDTILHPDALRVMVDFLSMESDYAIVGCWQAKYVGNWDEPNDWTIETVDEAGKIGRKWELVRSTPVLQHYYVQGSALMIRADVLSRIGFLDGVYGTFYEETDLCRRASYAGYKIGLLGNARVQHVGGGNWRRTRFTRWKRDWLMLRNELIYQLSALEAKDPLKDFVRILFRQALDVFRGNKEFTLPVFLLPLLVPSILAQLTVISQMRLRNQQVANEQAVSKSMLFAGRKRPAK